MSTLYTRVYSYTGQGSWTAAARKVSFSDFAVSGDTDRSIGQIVSLRYEHYHASGSSRTWALSGRISFSDGTSVTSDSVSSYISGNKDVVKYVNTFETLPTPAQLESATYVETLANASSANNGVLTWTARSGCPLRIVVGFYEEPPYVYRPRIEAFSLKRANASGVQDDSGSRALLTLRLSLESASYASLSTLKLHYAAGEVSASSPSISLTGRVSALLSGVTDNSSYITAEFDADFDWNFLLVFACGDESASATAALPNNFVSFHISPCSTGGVSVGDLSSATEGNPKFEVHHPAYFYDGLMNIRAGTVGQLGATAAGAYKDGAVVFDAPFAVGCVPTVLIGFRSDSTAGTFGRCAVAVQQATNTGFTFRFFNGDASNRNPDYHYIAFGTPE